MKSRIANNAFRFALSTIILLLEQPINQRPQEIARDLNPS